MSKDRTEMAEDRAYRDDVPNRARISQDKTVRQIYVPGKGYLGPVSTTCDPEQQRDEQKKQQREKNQLVRPVFRRSLSRDPLSDYEILHRQPFKKPDEPPEKPREVLEDWSLPEREPAPRTAVITERGFTIRRGAYLGPRGRL